MPPPGYFAQVAGQPADEFHGAPGMQRQHGG